ncbi:hypothetical protein [Mycolicibacterium tusciae]|uniref:Uncharacterized protein n=1 Tax=Mycolicibacterium tusciae TaxID=75922 RepID=A0A1X0K0K6_9MYCO|nr:hypothetical protein [Mycolicibacterium tusciae]ORB68592.1 hypothetical protein BST47_01375 [Mycolicibacterium tusciae]
MSFEANYVRTRRQLRGVAESLIAGPQYRSAGTIRLAVRPDGFSAVTIPVAVHGTELVLPNHAVPLEGPMSSIAEAAGIVAGPPEGVYTIVDALPPDADLRLDAHAAEWVNRSHYGGGYALKTFLPECHPVLWPEHFDVAVTQDEVNYGVSAGDDQHPMPYAYVNPQSVPTGEFWNASFGALYPLDPAADIDSLASHIADFFERGRRELDRSAS